MMRNGNKKKWILIGLGVAAVIAFFVFMHLKGYNKKIINMLKRKAPQMPVVNAPTPTPAAPVQGTGINIY